MTVHTMGSSLLRLTSPIKSLSFFFNDPATTEISTLSLHDALPISTVDLPAPPNEVIVPASALVEDGRTSIVFVQPDPNETRYTLRRVSVSRSLPGTVAIRGTRSEEHTSELQSPEHLACRRILDKNT